jgi:hypothetical protein
MTPAGYWVLISEKKMPQILPEFPVGQGLPNSKQFPPTSALLLLSLLLSLLSSMLLAKSVLLLLSLQINSLEKLHSAAFDRHPWHTTDANKIKH